MVFSAKFTRWRDLRLEFSRIERGMIRDGLPDSQMTLGGVFHELHPLWHDPDIREALDRHGGEHGLKSALDQALGMTGKSSASKTTDPWVGTNDAPGS